MMVSMDDVVVIVAVVIIIVIVVVLIVGGDANLSSEMVEAQVIVIVQPRVVMGRKTVVEIQSRHRRHGDARVRRPHALKRRRVV